VGEMSDLATVLQNAQSPGTSSSGYDLYLYESLGFSCIIKHSLGKLKTGRKKFSIDNRKKKKRGVR